MDIESRGDFRPKLPLLQIPTLRHDAGRRFLLSPTEGSNLEYDIESGDVYQDGIFFRGSPDRRNVSRSLDYWSVHALSIVQPALFRSVVMNWLLLSDSIQKKLMAIKFGEMCVSIFGLKILVC